MYVGIVYYINFCLFASPNFGSAVEGLVSNFTGSAFERERFERYFRVRKLQMR